MRKWLIYFLVLLIGSCVSAQEINGLQVSKKISFSKDTLIFDKISINPKGFKVYDLKGNALDSTKYEVDFQKSKIIFNSSINTLDSVKITYFKYPEFLTKKYSIYDEKSVIPNGNNTRIVFENSNKKTTKPFDGLNTSGSISRGITIGNNQNTVLNSNLDLQITGKLSEKVSLRASIQDSNIPLQDGGYSQKLDEFDQIFIELFSDKWNIRAGDLFLENRKSTFLNFNKKVQGLSTQISLGKESKTDLTISGALVRGQYAKSSFIGQEGNQGPYKLRGNNGELYVLVISGSERVYVNGILKTRGENNDYIIDYNAGELIFTSIFPITSEMRIVVEYQYTDRNYSRFITYNGINHERDKWQFSSHFYAENDIKNQPLQQNLSQEQIVVLQNAGDNLNLMNASSAYLDSYSENKILYKKEVISGSEIFVFSNNPSDELYNVRFTLVGTNNGNYILSNYQAVGKIYEYIAPISGVKQGNYEPIIPLVAPIKMQMGDFKASFLPSENQKAEIELAFSEKDKNLFSSINDDDNKGYAVKINTTNRILNKKNKLDIFTNLTQVDKNFNAIERLYSIEFNRDWNINTTFLETQRLFSSGLNWIITPKNSFQYSFENLNFSNQFNGNKHLLSANFVVKSWYLKSRTSSLNSTSNNANSTFSRSMNTSGIKFNKNWIGADFNFENNKEFIIQTQNLSNLSQKYTEYGTHFGRGDSTKVFTEIGLRIRSNDSLQNNLLKRVNQSTSYYLKSQLIKNEKSNLSIFLNYRTLKFEEIAKKTESTLTSRIVYNDNYFNKLIQLNSSYENNAGSIPQQEFTYLEVAPTQGVYMWNDYNQNGIQELQEFEVAPFPDLAKYVRVYLPNQVFKRIYQNRFSQALTFNFSNWQNKIGILKFVSKFYNQTNYTIERKVFRTQDEFNLNPFSSSKENLAGLNASFRNSLFYNRGKQHLSFNYTFISNQLQTLLSVGSNASKNKSHQLQFQHLFQKSWLLTLQSKTIQSISESENYPTRNFAISGYQINPKLGYLFSKNTQFEISFEQQKKDNILNIEASLNQQKWSSSFMTNTEKGFNFSGEFSFINNDFSGNSLSAVGFQMLEGLQVGKNTTWRVLLQKNLTSYLEINLNYLGRKSENSNSVHTGNVQLRAFF